MAEPKTTAERVEHLFPWLLHWSISDERIRGFRSDAYALQTPAGWVLIDAVPWNREHTPEITEVHAIVMTHRNHQRSAWRLRKEFGAPVYAPAGEQELDEEPDELLEEGGSNPGGLRSIPAQGFTNACYLVHQRDDGHGVLFCGDLICQDPGGPYRFPVQPDYFDGVGGLHDAAQLIEWPTQTLCAAHAEPCLRGSIDVLEGAIARTAAGG